MKKTAGKFTVALLAAILTVTLGACAAAPKTVIDYADAESFEAALNRGENLEGKVVSFKALELHPDSALGYNVWAGDHLNFVSEGNPGIKVGDTVTVRASGIKSILKSWFISYEKVENAVIGPDTISSEKSAESSEGAKEAAASGEEAMKESGGASAEVTQPEAAQPAEKPTSENIDWDMIGYINSLGKPCVSVYVAVKNTSSFPIRFSDLKFEYEDDNGKLLCVDSSVSCIPDALKPGQTGYLYSDHYDISGIDVSNGFTFSPSGKIYKAEDFYEIEVSDVNVNLKDSLIYDYNIVARGTNNAGKDVSFAGPGAVLFDKENKVIGFCKTFESFDNGQKKAFELNGDLASEDYKPSDIARVEVYIQGDHLF